MLNDVELWEEGKLDALQRGFTPDSQTYWQHVKSYVAKAQREGAIVFASSNQGVCV